MRSYASLDELKAELAIPAEAPADPARDGRLTRALVVATAWVDHHLGIAVDDGSDTWPGESEELVVEEDVPASWNAATLVVAVRFLESPKVPFGAAGGLGDRAVRVSLTVPEAELILLGQRQSFGFA